MEVQYITRLHTEGTQESWNQEKGGYMPRKVVGLKADKAKKLTLSQKPPEGSTIHADPLWTAEPPNNKIINVCCLSF